MKSTNWILTYTGKQFYPFYPEYSNYEAIDIIDIAHALSMLCRFTGHCKEFYSVAEHCVRVADEVFERTKDYQTALIGLLHDASEAYLLDIAKPIKESDEFANYRILEKKVQQSIYFRFHLLSREMPRIIKEVDTDMLHLEAFHLMPSHSNWFMTTEPPAIKVSRFQTLSPKEAKEAFLSRTLEYGLKTALPDLTLITV